NGPGSLTSALLKRPESFVTTVTEKLLTYATGRKMSYGDRKLIGGIVDETSEAKGGFRDLLLALIESESFRTK
ncbi:MAG: DUF1585 domain-containing protein, partial [Opitutales bacterium]|nr:DUF1585 domain-containing protein [Opitutales bacterium]